jgi:hypothetical protein
MGRFEVWPQAACVCTMTGPKLRMQGSARREQVTGSESTEEKFRSSHAAQGHSPPPPLFCAWHDLLPAAVFSLFLSLSRLQIYLTSARGDEMLMWFVCVCVCGLAAVWQVKNKNID